MVLATSVYLPHSLSKEVFLFITRQKYICLSTGSESRPEGEKCQYLVMKICD